MLVNEHIIKSQLLEKVVAMLDDATAKAILYNKMRKIENEKQIEEFKEFLDNLFKQD